MRRIKCSILLLLVWIFAKVISAPCALVMAITVLPTDVEVATQGHELVGIEGSFATDVQEAIDLVNQYRLEACMNGYPNPNNPDTNLTPSDYVPIQWSSDLEYIARIRAAEASIYESNDRPNEKDYSSLQSKNGIHSTREALCFWSGDTMTDSIEWWYALGKEAWVNQESTESLTYTALIAPSYTHMGMAQISATGAAEFINANRLYEKKPGITLDTTPLPKAKNIMQTVEVPKSKLTNLRVRLDTNFIAGETARVEFIYTYDKYRGVSYLGDIRWKCNSNKITLKPDGTITAKKIGKHKIKFTYSGAKKGSFKKTITILPQTPSIKKIVTKKTSATIKFKKVPGVSGYQIHYTNYDDAYLRGGRVNVSKAKSSKTIKNLSRKNEYSFIIRSYKKVGKKTYYSAWSREKIKRTK